MRVQRPSRWMAVAASVLLGLAVIPASAAQLRQQTTEAFDAYVRKAEARMDEHLKPAGPFLWVDSLPAESRADSYTRLRNGEVLVDKIAAGQDLPGGMVHDWIALAFIPDATLTQTLARVQDYNDDYRTYAPEVLRSKMLRNTDDRFSVLLRIRKKSFVTVVLDITNDVHYFHLDSDRSYSRSYSTRIVEVEDPGTPQEHERPEGDDHGYLWRLYTYWRFMRGDGGVYVQCEAIALTRGIPFGLGWLVKPFVTKIPKESLLFTMTKTRDAIAEGARAPLQSRR